MAIDDDMTYGLKGSQIIDVVSGIKNRALSAEGSNSASHVLFANEIYTTTTQVDSSAFVYRTTAGSTSINTGTANLMMASGRCYQPAGESHEESLTISGTFADSETTASINQTTWKSQVSTDGDYNFSYDGSNWLLDESTVTLSDYGISISGMVASGDSIVVSYIAEFFSPIYVSTPTSFRATGFNQYNAEAGYAHVVGGNQYRIAGTYTSLGFTMTIGGTTTPVTVVNNKFTPTEDGYIYINGASGNILIALVWSGTMDSQGWVAYEESTINVPTQDKNSVALPTASYGLPGINSVSDVIDFEGGVYIKKIGQMSYSSANLATVKAMGTDYIFDNSNIFYILPEWTTYILEGQEYQFTANDYGTEEWVGTSVPIQTELRYGNSLVDKLRNLENITNLSGDFKLENSTLHLDGDGTAGFTNTNYRGKDLTNIYTIEQLSAKVRAGDFSDIRLGDYITKKVKVGSNQERELDFVIAGADYWYGIGDQGNGLETHHLVMVPDTAFYEYAQMNNTNTTTGGYYGSQMHGICDATYTAGTDGALASVVADYTTFLESNLGTNGEYEFVRNSSGQWTYNGSNVGANLNTYGVSYSGTPVEGDKIKVTFTKGNLEPYRQAIYNAFGNSHIIKHHKHLSISTSAGQWHHCRVELMNESMIYGQVARANNFMDECAVPTILPYFATCSNKRVAHRGKGGGRANAWLSSIYSGSGFCSAGTTGLAAKYNASYSIAVRPYFLFA